MNFRIYKKSAKPRSKTPQPQTNTPPPSGLEGKSVFFLIDGVRCGGVVKSVTGGSAEVQLAVPSDDGFLNVTDTVKRVNVSELEEQQVATRTVKIREWEGSGTVDADTKAVSIKDQNGDVVDFKNVRIKGYGSTFESFTKSDRDGDYVTANAFNESLNEFKRNPVMLIDHRNSVHELAGSYDVVRVDEKGLYLEGMLSNAPELRKVRFLIQEKHLKTLSMGGLFFYGEDGRAILKVLLYEVSLVAVPANPDAELFVTRSVSEETVVKSFKKFGKKSFATQP